MAKDTTKPQEKAEQTKTAKPVLFELNGKKLSPEDHAQEFDKLSKEKFGEKPASKPKA